MFRFAVLLLQVVRQLLLFLEQRRLIAEGERQAIATELVRVAQASNIANQIRLEVSRMSDEEVDAALRGDYRT